MRNVKAAKIQHLQLKSVLQVIFTCPPLCILFSYVCLVLKEDFGRFYIAQGNSKVQQGPAPWITLINILLSIRERNNAEAVLSNTTDQGTLRRAYINKACQQ